MDTHDYHADATHQVADIIVAYYNADFKKVLRWCKDMVCTLERTLPMLYWSPIEYNTIKTSISLYREIIKIIKQYRDGNR